MLGLPGVDGDRDGVAQDVLGPPPPPARLAYLRPAACCGAFFLERTHPGQLSPPRCPETLRPACVESGSLRWGHPDQVWQAAGRVSHPEKHGHRKPRFSCVLGLVTFEREN